MSFFNRIFKNSPTKEPLKTFINWIPLNTIEQLETIKEQSKKEPIAIFKHSTRCGISNMIIKKFEKSFDKELQHFKIYYLDLLNYREISNEISYTFQVIHQSPQILIIKNEETIVHESHYNILQINLKSF